MYGNRPIFGVELHVGSGKDSDCPSPSFPFLFLFSEYFNLKFLINYSKAVCNSIFDQRYDCALDHLVMGNQFEHQEFQNAPNIFVPMKM